MILINFSKISNKILEQYYKCNSDIFLIEIYDDYFSELWVWDRSINRYVIKGSGIDKLDLINRFIKNDFT